MADSDKLTDTEVKESVLLATGNFMEAMDVFEHWIITKHSGDAALHAEYLKLLLATREWCRRMQETMHRAIDSHRRGNWR